MYEFRDKVVVVTGASSGIGHAVAKAFAAEGARVVLAARSKEKLDELEASVRSSGGECISCVTDVACEEDCRRLIDKAVEEYGRIDILVNNAGISMRASFLDTGLSVIRTLMDVNFYGTVYCTKYALPHLLESRGSLVGVSSVAGFHGLPGRTGYSASKFAMQGFLETVRIENMKKGLHVLILCAGFTRSNIRFNALTGNGDMQGESPRAEDKMMSPEEVAAELLRGVRKRKRLMVLSFEGKFSYWTGKFFPGLLDKIFYNHMSREPDSPLR